MGESERVSDLAVRIYKKAQGRNDAPPSPVLQEITAKCRQLAHKTFAALDTGVVDTDELAIAAANEQFRREFTSNVTHELKSPITAILGAVEMLGDGTKLSGDEKRELFAIVSQESGRLGALVKDVLSLAEIERDEGGGTHGGACAETDPASACGHAGRVTLVPFDEIVVDIVGREAVKARTAHVRLNLVGNDAVQVRGDVLRLEEVLVNLIENALRYSGSERLDVKSVRAGGCVHVSVTDYGVGIPAEHLPHLFERF